MSIFFTNKGLFYIRHWGLFGCPFILLFILYNFIINLSHVFYQINLITRSKTRYNTNVPAALFCFHRKSYFLFRFPRLTKVNTEHINPQIIILDLKCQSQTLDQYYYKNSFRLWPESVQALPDLDFQDFIQNNRLPIRHYREYHKGFQCLLEIDAPGKLFYVCQQLYY